MKILNMDSENNKEDKIQEYTKRKTVIFYISEEAHRLAEKLKGLYPHALILRFKAERVSALWGEYRNFIFITATGIVVRTIAHLIKSKKTDPAVVVVSRDERFVISLLSGHEGGANEIARKTAKFLGAHPVITTASEIEKGSMQDSLQKNLVIGIGCNRGTSDVEIEDAVKKTLEKKNLTISSVHSIATIDKKANEEGLLAFARNYGLTIYTFTPDELNRVKEIPRSEIVYKATGANAVAEPAALLASGASTLLIPKKKMGNVTVAVAERKSNRGKIFIVGIGPGSIEYITPYARNAIKKADVIVGYETYISLIAELIKDKDVFSTGMTHEVERCKKAVDLALEAKTVAIISSGDPGIYGMAGLVLEVLKAQNTKQAIKFPSVEVIPGIPALAFSASKLGAPLMHDFACISLSDRLTPWGVIEKRIKLAALADFVIVLYNPRSRERTTHVERAREIILKHRPKDVPVGIVKAADRKGEKITITTLKDMPIEDIDMQTTIIIGNSQTFVWNGWMITPRGYDVKV